MVEVRTLGSVRVNSQSGPKKSVRATRRLVLRVVEQAAKPRARDEVFARHRHPGVAIGELQRRVVDLLSFKRPRRVEHEQA